MRVKTIKWIMERDRSGEPCWYYCLIHEYNNALGTTTGTYGCVYKGEGKKGYYVAYVDKHCVRWFKTIESAKKYVELEHIKHVLKTEF